VVERARPKVEARDICTNSVYPWLVIVGEILGIDRFFLAM
jgi:hypothetical protein